MLSVFRLFFYPYCVIHRDNAKIWHRKHPLRQNIGLAFLTLGSILLSLSVFRLYVIQFIYFSDWKNVPWESRLALRLLFRIRNRDDYFKWYVRSQDKRALGEELKDLSLPERLYMNLPIIALVLMVIGFFLCFNYSVLWKFIISLFWFAKIYEGLI